MLSSHLLKSIPAIGQRGNYGLPLFSIYTKGPGHVIEFSSLSGIEKGLPFAESLNELQIVLQQLDNCFVNGKIEEILLAIPVNIGGKVFTTVYLVFEPRINEKNLVEGVSVFAYDVPPAIKEEAHFFQLAEALPQLVWLADAKGKVFYYNGKVQEYSGAKKLENGTWQWDGLLHEEDQQSTVAEWKHSVETLAVYEKEHRVKMAAGDYQWHLSRAFPQKNTMGEVISWYGTATNIHAQKTFEEKIAEKEERLRIAIEAAELGTWDIDLITGVVIPSEKLNILLGLPANNPTSFNDFLQLVHPMDSAMVYEKSREVVIIENGIREFDLQFRIVRANDKEIRWMKARGKVYENKEGQYARFAGTMIDITKEKNTEREINYKKALLEAQNEATPDGMLIVDGKGKILSYNKQFSELWQMPKEIVKAGDDNAALAFAMSQVVDPEEFIKRVEYLYKHRTEAEKEEILLKDGRTLERFGKAVIGIDGTVYGWAWHFRDITEQKRTQQEIFLQKLLYQNILEGISDAFISYDFEWKLIYANEKAVDLSGKPVHQLLGKKLWELYPHMVDTPSFKVFQKVMTSREPQQFEYYSEYNQSWFETKVYPTIEGIAIFGININERKKAEEALNYQKKLLETVTENTSMGLFLLDDKNSCIYMNEAAEKLTGFTCEELQGKNIREFIPFPFTGQSSILNLPLHGNILPAAKRTQGEGFVLHKNGTSFEAAFTASPILLDQQHLGTVIEIRNITEEKKAEHALKESEERFRQLADLVPQIIFTAGADGKVNYFNKQWYDFTGFEKESGDHDWITILHPEDVQTTMDSWNHSVKTGELYQIEYRFKNKTDGSFRWFLGKAVPIRNKNDEIVNWFGTSTDIDDQKRFSEKLEGIVKERTEALERSNEDLQQFAHVASHDLKEPLRKIRTFSSRIFEEFSAELPVKAKSYLEKVYNAAHRMNTIIEGVLEYSIIDSMKQSIEVVDLSDILKNIEEDLEVVIHAKEARLQYGDFPKFEGSTILIHQLFYNLINNSLKFSRPGVPPEIRIDFKHINGWEMEGINPELENEALIEIILTDNGIGFNQDYAQRIFDTFSRLNPKDSFEGTGLGLSLCRKIVARHKGLISARGTEGQGASFTIVLPMRQNQPYLLNDPE
jgi:PAS domain S-box-containing protein